MILKYHQVIYNKML